MKTLLAIDSSSGSTSIALLQNGQIIANLEDNDATAQAQKLVMHVDGLVREHLEDYTALDAIVVTTGPGRFTSIRIALATARGIALAADLPLIGISALEAIGWEKLYANPAGTTAQIFINAHRGQVYTQHFRRSANGLEPMGAALLIDGNAENTEHPKAEWLASYALTLPAGINRPAEAFYIRPPDAKPQTPLV